MLVHHYLEYYARNNPNNPCLTQAGKTLSYADMDRQVNQLANGLLNLGVTAGQRVAVLGENGIEHLLTFYAASKIGAVAVSLNFRLAPAELAFIIKDSQSKALIMLDDTLLNTLNALTSQIPAEVSLITRRGDTLEPWDTWLPQQLEQSPNTTVEPSAPFFQLYTSGTTGNPKGVVLSHANLLSLCTMNTTLTPHRGSPGMADIICAPLFHIGGAGSIIISIFSGSHIVLHRNFDPQAIVSDIEEYPVNSMFMVPAMIMAVMALPGIEKRDFSKLKQIYYGASPISQAALKQAIEVFGVDFIQMYGMTETSGTVINLSAEDHKRALQEKPELLKSCGRPSVGAEVKVMVSDSQEAAADEVGEIWLKSDTNMLHYYNLPEETAKNLSDGWVHTGDAGYMDEEGYLYLKDRIKDMVVSGGENIYPVEVENAVANHPSVADVAVVGIPDKKFGEALLAFVVLKSGQSLTTEEMIDFCREHIAGYKIPRKLEILEEMPRNPSGKILKKDLRKPYWEGIDRQIG